MGSVVKVASLVLCLFSAALSASLVGRSPRVDRGISAVAFLFVVRHNFLHYRLLREVRLTAVERTMEEARIVSEFHAGIGRVVDSSFVGRLMEVVRTAAALLFLSDRMNF